MHNARKKTRGKKEWEKQSEPVTLMEVSRAPPAGVRRELGGNRQVPCPSVRDCPSDSQTGLRK